MSAKIKKTIFENVPGQIIHNHQAIGLICLSGLLFCAGWHQGLTFFFLSISFIPLLFLQDTFHRKPTILLYLYVFIAFILFIGCTTYWLAKFSLFGALTIWCIQAALWALVFTVFHLTKKHFGTQVGYLAFVAYFMGFEYYNFCVDFGWSWTNLGNGLAAFPNGVQWYQYTGISGGTLWILLLNVWIFILLKKWLQGQSILKKEWITLTMLWLLPLSISYVLFWNSKFPNKSQKESICIMQPNINSYQHKLSTLNVENLKKQVKHIQPLLKEIENRLFDLIILPETVFPYVVNIDSTLHHPANFLKPHLQAAGKLIFGMYLTNNKNQKYNAAVSIDGKENFKYHLKKRLVPGIEYLSFIKSNEKAFHKKYYTKPNEEILTNEGLAYPTAICYESMFGADIAKQSLAKNKVILILTNDGWFDNTMLIQQHLNIAKLRAIENRRFVLRAANSGISSVINHYGAVEQYLPNTEAGVLEYVVPKEFHQITFYQKYPDIIYRIFSLVAIILLLYTLVAQYTNNFKFKKLGFR